MYRHYLRIGIITAVLLLAGCGQTGPLYLPKDQQNEATVK